ncbi:hypothetical protein N7489_001872 [Penicillium chrysogenum]|uniref:uncharacterized protein n=1 Tax=Penicillium chrysogenum TaxID=5076 RepID=UPI0023A56F73|nr:uncharacterized protein N7489_001872 [Penicillium chrysogenum]KAJ5251462.1 hypothetical protein N7489_001872 [Penicillium chrysogenum]KAJ5262896.1 hypothetical protein N7524_008201 [Penicillium chrysogenum]
MLQNIFRHVQGPGLSISRVRNRRFSYVSRHSDFPASLYQFQIHRDSGLYDRAFRQDDWEYEDGVVVSADGLVHPNITADFSNGAVFMPNTHYMQEVTRRSNDYYLEDVESGKPAAEAHYLCLPKGDLTPLSKGTVIPKSLILFREHTSRFSLQPAHPMSLDTLNKTLSQFYLDFGRVFNPDAWLDMNPYHGAFSDHEEEWMNY